MYERAGMIIYLISYAKIIITIAPPMMPATSIIAMLLTTNICMLVSNFLDTYESYATTNV